MRPSLSTALKLSIVLPFCVSVAWSFRHRPGSCINPFYAEHIEPGMTLQQASDILGAPPGNYTTLSEDELDYSRPAPGEPRWANDEYCVWVMLDAQGKVDEVFHVQSWARFRRLAQERPFWWRVRGWLGF